MPKKSTTASRTKAFRASARRALRTDARTVTNEERAMALAQEEVEPTIAVHTKDGELIQQPVPGWVLAFGDHVAEEETVLLALRERELPQPGTPREDLR